MNNILLRLYVPPQEKEEMFPLAAEIDTDCVVPENIHTSTTEGPPHPSGISPPGGC